ncbi:MAG: cytochrome c oxidase assembly protein [Mycobacteriales bacterium]
MDGLSELGRAWTFDPVVALPLVGLGGSYAAAARSVSQRHPNRPWPRSKAAAFFAGLALAWFALLGPVGRYDDVFFWAHMTQHLLLMMVVAPLLLLGAPVLLALRACSPATRHDVLVPVLRSKPVRLLTDPTFSWLLFAGVVVGTHFTPFYDVALRHRWVHLGVEHPLYLGAGLLYFYPLLGSNPAPRRPAPALRVVSLFLMMVPETLTGFFLYMSSYVRYPFYASGHRPFGPGPLADQQLGGALMWAGSMVVDAVWIALGTLEWLSAEERRSRRLDAQLAQETAAAAV